MSRLINFSLGFAIGAAVGAGLGLLTAPASGDNLIGMLRARINEIVEEGRKAAAEREAELQAQLAAAKQI
ncbi:MAG TPA: YtxH domain-containing protein [Anaerolineae bacterium]|nr:YtxH domain-containing protein [Anaerolineae bacterium]